MEVVTDQLMHGLSNQGHQVTLLTTKFPDAAPETTPFEAYTIDSRSGRYSLTWWLRSRSFLDKYPHLRPDVLVSVSVAGCLLAKRARIPSVSHCHGTFLMELKSSLRSLSFRECLKLVLNSVRSVRDFWAYRVFDRVVAVGPVVQRSLVGLPLRLRPSSVVTVLNGVNKELLAFSEEHRKQVRHDCGCAADDLLLGFVGRLHPHKNPAFVIELIKSASLQGLPVRLVIVGTGPLSESLRAQVAKLDLRHSVIFLDEQDRNAVARLYSGLDVLLMPSRRVEGLPLVPLEACSSGCTVLCAEELRACLPSSLPVRFLPLQIASWRKELEHVYFDLLQRARQNLGAGLEINSELDMVSAFGDELQAVYSASRQQD